MPQFEARHRLALALETSGVTVAEMAAELGVNRNTVGNYLAGRSQPNTATRKVWAMRCGVPFEWIETGTTTTGRNPGDTMPVTIRYPSYLRVA